MYKDPSIPYPIRMAPVFKNYIWGGDRLIREWGKSCEYGTAAESWELSAHKNGQSTAENGPLTGMTLDGIVEIYGKQCLGSHSMEAGRFPIMIKFIDPKHRLSIQVHPDDDYALRNEGDYGKTEMWYIAEADEGSGILCGFKNDMTKGQFLESIKNGTIEEKLNWIPVKKGDIYFIAPGTVHAICEGVIIIEIQQNSDVTYRIFDYNRKDSDNKERPLHIDKALDVSRLSKDTCDGKPQGPEITIPGAVATVLARCPYFTVKEYKIKEACNLSVDDKSFQSLVFAEGCGIIECNGEMTDFQKGSTFFLPTGMGDYTISGNATVLVTEV